MDKNVENNKTDKLHALEEKRVLPVFVKYGLIAVAVIAAVVVGLLIYFNVAVGYVATVDGQKIKTGEYKYYLEVQKQIMFASAKAVDSGISEETFWATKIGGEDAIEIAKKKALDSLKEVKIQLIKAKEAKVALASSDVKKIDESIQSSIIQSMGIDNKIQANKAFEKQYGITKEDFVNAQIDNYTVQKYQASEIAKISDADANVDTYYSKNPEWYKEDTQFRKGTEEAVWARQILIMVADTATQADKDAAKKKAEDLVAKIKGGADFGALVKENSEDPGSKDRGGDYLFGKGQMYPEFEAAAFSLKPGEITEAPVLTKAGYHILKLEEKYAKDEPASLKAAKEYSEYGTGFVKYKLYMEKVAGWAKDAKYKVNLNLAAYNSIK